MAWYGRRRPQSALLRRLGRRLEDKGFFLVPPQMQPTPGAPERKGEIRREERVAEMLDTLPEGAQQAIREEWASRGHGNGKVAASAPAGATSSQSDAGSNSSGVDEHYGSDEN